MIELPKFEKSWEYENGFYLTCDSSRISKFVAHYELFKMISDVPGAIVECGVFKGASLNRFAMFRSLFGSAHSRKIIGFDTFGKFPETLFQADEKMRKKFIEAAGDESISREQLQEVLRLKKVNESIDLVEGDILETVPNYIEQHPELRIAIINLDTDIYEPAKIILEQLYPRLVPGGILVLDDYGVFPGETAAVDEYFRGRKILIQKFPYASTPCFVQKTRELSD